ncbi:MAG: carbon-nitrogen hydrolase family protein [Planctomycetota bacterium]
MATIRVAIMQIGYETRYGAKGRTLAQNIDLVGGYLDAAGELRADLAIAPECWSIVGIGEENVREFAEPIPGDGPIFRMFRDRARTSHTHVVGWSFEMDGPRTFNTAFLIAPDGRYLGKYRKTHPVPIEETERMGISPGEELPVFDLPFGRVGIMICFDHFFPEVARVLAIKGARLICLPSMNSPHHAWSTRLAARAMDNACFLAASVVLGDANAEGEAGIYDPKGMLVASPGQRDGVAVGEIDLERPYVLAHYATADQPHLLDVRRFLLGSRRPHLYGDLTREAQDLDQGAC